MEVAVVRGEFGKDAAFDAEGRLVIEGRPVGKAEDTGIYAAIFDSLCWDIGVFSVPSEVLRDVVNRHVRLAFTAVVVDGVLASVGDGKGDDWGAGFRWLADNGFRVSRCAYFWCAEKPYGEHTLVLCFDPAGVMAGGAYFRAGARDYFLGDFYDWPLGRAWAMAVSCYDQIDFRAEVSHEGRIIEFGDLVGSVWDVGLGLSWLDDLPGVRERVIAAHHRA